MPNTPHKTVACFTETNCAECVPDFKSFYCLDKKRRQKWPFWSYQFQLKLHLRILEIAEGVTVITLSPLILLLLF